MSNTEKPLFTPLTIPIESDAVVDCQIGSVVQFIGDGSNFRIEPGEKKAVYWDEENDLVTTKPQRHRLGFVVERKLSPGFHVAVQLDPSDAFTIMRPATPEEEKALNLPDWSEVFGGEEIPTIATDDDFKKDSILMNLEGRE